MKKILRYGLMTCVLGMMFSCADELKLSQSAPYNPGWTFEDGIEINLGFPEMQKATTSRAMDVDEPALEDLDVFLFVFDGNSLKQTIHIPAVDTEPADDAEGDTHPSLTNHIKFTVYLPQTDNNAVIHIVALDDARGEFAQQIDAVGYGLEDAIMPKFNVSGDQDAYWQRIDLGCPIICSVDNNEDENLETVKGTETTVRPQLELVQMVRNFACVQLTIAPEVNNFTVLGWTVVNDLDGGSVTPWYSPTGVNDILYPNFVVDDKTNGGKKIADYDDLVAQGYPGVSYSGANLRHKLEDVGGTNASAGNNWYKEYEKIYLYDRKVSSVNPLYLLIYGSLNNNPGYYKVSLSNRNTTTGLVTEYNVLRNIQYTIHITGVTAPGYETPEDAAKGPAFNNISGDVTTRSMLQISDGVDMLFVNFVTYVVTQKDQEVQFMYRYLENILVSSGTLNNDFVEWNAVKDSNPAVDGHGGHFSTLAEAVGLKTQFHDPNAVVTEIGIKTGMNSYGRDTYTWYQDMADQNLVPYDTTDTRTHLVWKTMKLRFVEPTEELKEQKFVVYTPPQTFDDGTTSVGLSRIINLVVRVPWDYERVRIYPGVWDADYSEFPVWTPDPNRTPDNEGEIYVGPNAGNELALFFELPAGLPQSMFPMEFVIESDRQNIENSPKDNAAVQNGESLFKNDQGVNDLRIQYVKTVLWDEYAPDGEKSTKKSRVVRVRFLTTTNMSDYPNNIDNIVTTVRIHNQAFNDVDYKFTRKKGQAATPGS